MGNKSKWQIGVCIAKLRESKGLSQKQLSEELGKMGLNVRRETVTQWENGTRDLKTEYTIRLAEFFGVSCDYILRGVDASNLSAAEETGLSNNAVNSLKKISEMTWWFGKSMTPAQVLDRMISNKHFIGLILQLHSYFAEQKKYDEKCSMFAKKYAEYDGDEPDDIMKAAAECAAFDGSCLRSDGHDLLKQQDVADFEMYRLEKAIKELAEDCAKEE